MMDAYLPANVDPAQVVGCLGLISDTHMPQRCLRLPQAVFTALAGVDGVLHAGDLGKLWVLDALSAIAPVVAVHGNDEPSTAIATLPEQVLLGVNGRRLLLWHSHYPDRTEELANRRGDEMVPNLRRIGQRARDLGAAWVVFGHWHIPLVYADDGVLLVNPGAIASGIFTTRQVVQTVARLYLLADGTAVPVHIDLAQPERPYRLPFDPAAGFRANLDAVTCDIAEPLIVANLAYLQRALAPLAERGLLPPLLATVHRVWAGETELLRLDDLSAAVAADPDVTPELEAAYTAVIANLPIPSTGFQ